MSQVEFIYNGVNTIIQCNPDDKMTNIFQKFRDKVVIEKNKEISYSYNGKVGINEELNFQKLANSIDKERNKMSIVVLENEIQTKQKEKDLIKSKNVICPICKENIILDIIDYKIYLSECKNRHKMENILLNEFEKTQYIDRLTIICDVCKIYNQSLAYNNVFYKCNACKINICSLCKTKHDKSHKIINYDDKYYICDIHNEDYISYCDECKTNICTSCNKHKFHNKLNFIDILPNKDELTKKLKVLKNFIDLLTNDINTLINILNEVTNKMKIYYHINEDIINNFDSQNRNYETIYYLNQFQKNDITGELNKILESNTLIDKFIKIFNIYSKMNFNEIQLVYNMKDKKEVKLFGKDFVDKYKKCCTIIKDGKEKELKEKYTLGTLSKKIDLLQIKLKGVANITDMFYMFNDCSDLISLPDISRINTSNVINMGWMFSNCSSLSSLPNISEWNTSNVKDMRCMFNNCSSLSSLPDISKWNIYNVTSISGMFAYCSSLKSLPDISKWDTSNIIDMSYMFSECSSLLSLPDISEWNTIKVTNTSGMFSGCSLLTSLPDISKWDTTKLTDMYDMFDGCKDSLNIPSKFK